jgi:hypothetical protein
MAAMTSWRRTGVGEVRHAVGPLVDVCCEGGVGPPDVEGRRSMEARERGPFLCERGRDSKLGRLVPPVCSPDGQRIDLGERGVSGREHNTVDHASGICGDHSRLRLSETL